MEIEGPTLRLDPEHFTKPELSPSHRSSQLSISGKNQALYAIYLVI
jgi:hypothetical protein